MSRPHPVKRNTKSLNDEIEPLIPTRLIDVKSQKVYFVGIFCLIQAWKVQQCIILKAAGSYSDSTQATEYDQFAFILKFFIIDSLYLWLLPVFRIPLLTFNPFITFLQSILVTAFTIFLSCNFSVLFSSVAVPFYSLFRPSGKSLSNYDSSRSSGLLKNEKVEILGSGHKKTGNVYDKAEIDSHFKGKKTINILPKSTSYFNPFAENYCIDISYSIPTIANKISIPIKFNSSNEIAAIEVLYTDYNNVTTTLNYQKKQVKSMKVNDKHKFLNYLRKDLIVNGHQFINNDLELTISKTDKSRISFVELPIEKPGLYRVGKVFDDKELPIKVHQSSIIVSQCPIANVYDADTRSSSSDQSGLSKDYKCIGDYNNLVLNVNGVPPLRVKYKKFVNEKVEVVEEKLLKPQDFESPLVAAASIFDETSKSEQASFLVTDFLAKLSSKELKNFYIWSNNYQLQLNISNIVSKVGDYSYQLEEVEDGFGNLINLTRIYGNEYHYKHRSEYPSVEDFLKSKQLFQTYKAYGSPRLKLTDSVPNKPLIENESRELKLIINGLDYNSHQNIRELQRYEPIYANISYISNNDNVLDNHSHNKKKRTMIEDYEFNSANNFKFPVENAGSYALESVDLKFCPGSIDDSNKRIDIFRAFKPYLSVMSNASIDDTCLGQIGLSFDLLLTGIPPFEVKVNNYKLKDNGSKQLIGSKKLKIPSSNRFQYNYEPENEGNYEIEFHSIRDNIYKNFISLEPSDKYRFTTSMRAKPDAVFLDIFNQHGSDAHHRRVPIEKKLCLSSESEILPVKLNGEAPFEITYDIVESATSRRKSYSSKSINGNNFNLKLPIFTKGGKYVVSLTSVKDKSNCVVLIDGQDININIKKELPYAEFKPILGGEIVTVSGKKGYKIAIKEGEIAELPVKLVGENNVVLSYRAVDSDNKLISGPSIRFDNHHNEAVFHSKIKVSKAGVYSLTGVKDNLCLGNVDELSFYNVTYYPKPELVINESLNSGVSKKFADVSVFNKKGICLNERHNVIDLVLKGKAPFVIDYEIQSPNGVRKPKSIKVSSNFVSINVLSNLQNNERMKGAYKYVFKYVSDDIYSKSDLRSLRSYNFEEQVIEQNVLPIPGAKFNHKKDKKVLQTCSNNLLTNNNKLRESGNRLDGKDKFLDPLVLSLQGSAPFDVDLEIYSENFNKLNTLPLRNIQTSQVHLNKEIYDYLSLGNHFITIKKVVDGKGCVKEDFPAQTKELNSISVKNANLLLDNQIMISITDVPKITRLTSADNLCVGEYVNYKLHGTGPFEIQYLFNKSRKKVAVKDLVEFKRYLVEPGTLEIVSIRDAYNCHVELTPEQREALKITIHGKPSVEIINANDESIQEGDEVDIIFKFDGVPPFNLIYRRIFNDFKDFEIYHVNNIEGYDYGIKTSLQGSYDAIEIKDAYCEVRRNV